MHFSFPLVYITSLNEWKTGSDSEAVFCGGLKRWFLDRDRALRLARDIMVQLRNIVGRVTNTDDHLLLPQISEWFDISSALWENEPSEIQRLKSARVYVVRMK